MICKVNQHINKELGKTYKFIIDINSYNYKELFEITVGDEVVEVVDEYYRIAAFRSSFTISDFEKIMANCIQDLHCGVFLRAS